MDKMERIAFAVHTYLGPSSTFIYNQLKTIRSYKVTVLTQLKGNLDQFPHPRIVSISDLPFWQRHLEYLTNYFGRFSCFKKTIREQNIKLIHAHFGWEGIFILPLRRYFNLPLVTSLYGSDINRWPRKAVYRRQLQRLFSEGDIFLAVSNDLRKTAVSLGCPEHKIMVHDWGIDLERFKPSVTREEKDALKILMCGRLVEYKGFKEGIEAFAQSLKNHRTIGLEIIGDGPLKKELVRTIQKLGLEKHVTLSGSKTYQEVARAMREADIFMMPYSVGKHGEREGLPNVIKEAQATGLPVISTALGGVPEVVREGVTGFLIQEKDPAGLAQKLSLLIEKPELRTDFGKKGRELVEQKYDLVKQTRKLEDIYRKLIRKP